MPYSERSISFDHRLLAAVRSGHKTVTRRRLAPDSLPNREPGRYRYCGLRAGHAQFQDERPGSGGRLVDVPCPLGRPGDRLRVLEEPELVLEIRALRAEPVRAITAAGARTEGMLYLGAPPTRAVEAFRELIEGFYPGCWVRNDWVWVVEFRLLPTAEFRAAGLP